MAHKGRKDTGSLKVEHPLTGPASACRLPSDMFPAQTRGDKDRLIFSVRLEKERGMADTIGVCVWGGCGSRYLPKVATVCGVSFTLPEELALGHGPL